MKKLLINLLKPRFFNQVLADVCNFNTVFFADPELYSFWWRVVFIADPHSWRADGSVDVSQLSEALLRLMLVLNDGSPVGFQANGVRDVVKRCWQTSLPGRREDEVAMLIRRLPDELDGLMRTWPLLKAWQSEAANYIKESLWIPDATDEDIGDLRSELDVALASGRLNQGQRRMLTDILDCKPLKFRQVLQERVELARDFLEKGRCCVAGMPRRLLGSESLPPSIDRWFDFIDTVVVFHAYLKLLKEQCQDRRGNMLDCLLPLLRKDGSTDQARLHSDPGCLYYNPRGGSFTSDINFRRRYLRWRGALIMSLWDISEQGKLREW
jgi:hypothetical protein